MNLLPRLLEMCPQVEEISPPDWKLSRLGTCPLSFSGGPVSLGLLMDISVTDYGLFDAESIPELYGQGVQGSSQV